MTVQVPAGRYQPRITMQRAGYYEFSDPHDGQISYIRRLGSNYYPRFHVYLDIRNDQWRINLHLDQKQPSYGTAHKHSGEYDGELVEEEMERIIAAIQ